MIRRNRLVLFGIIMGAVLLAALLVSPSSAAAGGVSCGADPSAVVLGARITIRCTGFDPNTFVNSYVVEATGFSEVGRSNYTACMFGTRTPNNGNGTSKTDEQGAATFYWYTQDGSGNPSFCSYDGYANQLGTYTVVVQELDGRKGVKLAGKTQVRLLGKAVSYTGATLTTDAVVHVGSNLTVNGSGFAPNEAVNIWFTRPLDCSGLGWGYWTGVSAFDPEHWTDAGVVGSATVKADAAGNFTAKYLFGTLPTDNAYPCLGMWAVTARALKSNRGAEAQFVVRGNSVANNARVWTDEASVPAIGQKFGGELGIGVHVHGSGFPAGARVTCWLTRPDGVVYDSRTIGNYKVSTVVVVGADGTFSLLALSQTSDIAYQGEQPGLWFVSCRTTDGKVSGIAQFRVFSLPFADP